MSVWSADDPASPSLSNGEGDLVSVSINVDPRELESLLEVLAQLDFPVNPQIYHDAALVYTLPDGSEESHPATLVEFPAYECRLPQVRAVLADFGFNPSILSVAAMWDAIHTDGRSELAPAGAQYRSRRLVKHRAAATA
jgi:hypothetical protein